MGMESRHEPTTNRPESPVGDRPVQGTSDIRRARTPWTDLGYIASTMCLLLGGLGAMAAIGAIPVSLIVGEATVAIWSLAVVGISALIGWLGIRGMARWDYYTPPPI